MLELTPTESQIVEFLKSGPKTIYEIEQAIDEAKQYSEGYVRQMVFRINKKRKIIDSFVSEGYRRYRLMESEMNVEYQILEGVNEIIDDAQHLKMLVSEASTAAYAMHEQVTKRMNWVLVAAAIGFGVMMFGLGYFVGAHYAEVIIDIDRGDLEQLIEEFKKIE